MDESFLKYEPAQVSVDGPKSKFPHFLILRTRKLRRRLMPAGDLTNWEFGKLYVGAQFWDPRICFWDSFIPND